MRHSSQRLVRDLLTCIRDLSDVSTKNRNLTPLLLNLLQLLRTNDLKIKLLCTQILSNLSANNKPNKEFLIKNQIISQIFYVLFETETILDAIRNNKAPPNLSGQLLEEIQVKI